MAVGLTFAVLLVVLGGWAGARQVRALRRVGAEPHLPDVDRRYLRGQGRRRLFAAGLLAAVGAMIGYYYLSGMDARMDAIGAKGRENVTDDDKDFYRRVGVYWIAVILLVVLVVLVAILDFWATRVYGMALYREIQADHDAKLQRDLAVYRRQKLDNRAKGLRKPDDDDPADPDST
ncbi:MAG: hypothetical protein C0501_06265 [Isosphaera sp.]|nr:hypothetical protein [Isosphaera sp.]